MDSSTEFDRETQKQIVECYHDLGLAYDFEKEIVANFVESIEEFEDEMSISLENDEIVDEIVDDSSEIEDIGTRLNEQREHYQKWFPEKNTFKLRFVFDIKK